MVVADPNRKGAFVAFRIEAVFMHHGIAGSGAQPAREVIITGKWMPLSGMRYIGETADARKTVWVVFK